MGTEHHLGRALACGCSRYPSPTMQWLLYSQRKEGLSNTAFRPYTEAADDTGSLDSRSEGSHNQHRARNKAPEFLFTPQRCPAPRNRGLESRPSPPSSGSLLSMDLAPCPFLTLGENTNLHSSSLQDALGRCHRSFIYGWISRHRKAPWCTASWTAEI